MIDHQSGFPDKLWALIKDARIAMFTTRQPDGRLRSCPLTMRSNPGIDQFFLLFLAPRTCESVADLQQDTSVSIAYSDPKDGTYVTVSGSACLVEDMARRKNLLSEGAEIGLVNGIEEEDLALIRVRVTQAEYWDIGKGKLLQLYNLAADPAQKQDDAESDDAPALAPRPPPSERGSRSGRAL